MPNLSGFPALDVAIGLAFMFFLCRTGASVPCATTSRLVIYKHFRGTALGDGPRFFGRQLGADRGRKRAVGVKAARLQLVAMLRVDPDLLRQRHRASVALDRKLV